MTLKELTEKRGRLVTEARAALEEIKANTDEARAAELEKRHDNFMAEFDRLEQTIAREAKLAEIEAKAEEARGKRRPRPADSEARGDDDGDTIEYRKVFAKVVCGVAPSDLPPEERAVLRTGQAEFRAQTAGTTTAGGFTVPTELANQIIKTMLMYGPMYDGNLTTEIATAGGNPIKIPTVNDTTVTAEDHTEATALTDDGGKDVTFGQKSLDAYGFDTEFIRWSWELEMDSIFNMENWLGGLLGERLGRIANLRLTTGLGSSAPHGIVTASSAGVTAASTTLVAWEELIKLQHSIDPAYRSAPKVRWMFNDVTLMAIRLLRDGEGRPLLSLDDALEGRLLGKPYILNNAMATAATGTKPIVYGDFGKYFVRKVGAPIIGVMRERFWPDLGIAGLIRFDGELGDTTAVKHLIMA